MKIVGIALLIGLCGYALGVATGYVLVQMYSSNRFDRGMEAVMTGFFFVGPAGAVLGFVGAVIVQLVNRARG